MHREKGHDQGGQDQDVEDEEPGDELHRRELAPEEEERQPRPREGDGERDRVAHPDTGARQQVVEQRVPEEPVGDRQQQQGDADRPVELAGAAEGAGEEDPAEVDDEGGHEHQGRPVVHLAHHQPGPHAEADVEGGGVGGRHLDTV